MRIAGAGLNQTPLDWAENILNISNAIQEAKTNDVDLLCFSELCITGYGCEDMFLYPWVAAKALDVLESIIPETTGITIAVGLPLWFEGNLYNTACVIKNTKILGIHAKQNLARDGVHYEPRWFTAWEPLRLEFIELLGNKIPFGDQIFELNEARIGFEICEDAWVDNRPASRLVEKNVNLILNPSASHFAINKSIERERMVVESSKKFNCVYLFVNQLGNEAGRIIYDGDVSIAKSGVLISSVSLLTLNPYQFAFADIALDINLKATPSTIVPHVSDMEQFTAAVSLGLFDYLRKSHTEGFVLSISGGADSSACLILIVEMIKRSIKTHGLQRFLELIGKKELEKHVTNADGVINKLMVCVYQHAKYSSESTFLAAKELASSVNAQFYNWSIDNEVAEATNIIEGIIGRPLEWSTDDLALQNIQARERSPVIWMLANIKNALLITTSNRSEGSVGYTTMDGDTSGSLAPLAGIDKPFIMKWLLWAKTTLGYAALSQIINFVPTAELKPADELQTDENDLMPYDILNKIEVDFVQNRRSPFDIHEALSKTMPADKAATYVIKFFKLWSQNQWKRERIAPSFQLSQHNIDPKSWFRFPILSSGFHDELQQLEKFIF